MKQMKKETTEMEIRLRIVEALIPQDFGRLNPDHLITAAEKVWEFVKGNDAAPREENQSFRVTVPDGGSKKA